MEKNSRQTILLKQSAIYPICPSRTEQRTLYSPREAPPSEGKEGRAVESEVLIVKAQKAKEPSLFWALCLTFGPYFLISCLYKIIQDILMFVGPEILR